MNTYLYEEIEGVKLSQFSENVCLKKITDELYIFQTEREGFHVEVKLGQWWGTGKIKQERLVPTKSWEQTLCG